MALAFDPFAADWRDDPYPIYRRLRDQAPIHWSPERELFCVTRYDDAMAVLKDPERFSSRAMFTMLMSGGSEKPPPLTFDTIAFLVQLAVATRANPLGFANMRNLIAEDGDSHLQMRAVVNRGFTPRRVAAWEGRAREVTEACLAPLRRGEPFDLVRDLAVPLPTTIIAEMLGVPTERLADFKRWSDTTIEITTGPGRDDMFAPRYRRCFSEMMGFFMALVRARRREPRDDLISLIVAEQDGELGLSDREALQFVMLLLVAGNETTTNLIGNVTAALLDHPAVAERVAADPARIPAMIEEGLRYDSPVQVVFRSATEDVELHGVRIPSGRNLAVYLGSANRDERRFRDPDVFDIDRDPQAFPAFGFGKHFCLGASLARLEARIAFEALAPLLPRLAAPRGPLERIDSFLVRGPTALPLRSAA